MQGKVGKERLMLNLILVMKPVEGGGGIAPRNQNTVFAG